MGILDRLLERQLIVVTGKGGVGKSAVAAALGRCLAARGRRVLLLEVDPRENLHEFFGLPPSGGDLVEAGPGIALQNLDPRRSIEHEVRQHLPFAWLAERIIASPVFGHFVATAPGIKEIAILGHAYRVFDRRGASGVRAGMFDTVVLDAPATGHGVSLLAAPARAAAAVRGGPFAEMTRQLSDWLGKAGRAGVVVVARAEEMPAQEALELRAALEGRTDTPAELLVVNALYPPFEETPDLDPRLAHLWRTRRALNESERARLAAGWDGAQVELPLLALPRGRELGAALARLLGERLAVEGA